MANIAKKVEVGANVAIIIAVVIIGILFVRNQSGRQQAAHEISVGTKFALQDVNWTTKEKSIVFALSTTCHFCSESADFYRQISEACKERNIRTIAVFPQSAAAAEEYTKKMGLHFDEVRQASLSGLEISGTPTLLIIDNGGLVRNVWVGKLPMQTEKEVLAKVGS
jgi:peroxiredoxin